MSTDNDKPMVTLLLILMMACNLWVLLYLTWERKESRKADGKDGIEPAREPLPDVIGKSKFRMPETKPQTATPTPNAATEMQSEAVDEKDVTFDDEMETSGSHSVETKPSRQVPDEELDEVFRDNRVHDTDGEFDGEQPQAGGNTFDEIDRAARAVRTRKQGNPMSCRQARYSMSWKGRSSTTCSGATMPGTKQGCRKWWKPILQASGPQRRKQE